MTLLSKGRGQISWRLRGIWALVVLLSLLVACQEGGERASPTPPVGPTLTLSAVVPTSAPGDATAAQAATGTSAPVTAAETPTAAEALTVTASPSPEPPTATPAPSPQLVTAIRLVPVLSGLDQPTYLTHAGDSRFFITEQPGRIRIAQEGRLLEAPFLDLTDRVGSRASEQGLLSVAFHPQYAENGFFYVDYTDVNGDTVVSRFRVADDDPNRADPGSESILLTVNQPYGNHNGGQLLFGPEGYLYVGMGDGGSAGDPQNNGQNPATLLGSLLRLDVTNVDETASYAIPPDNPFADGESGRREVWAYGLRNPWRFAFDALTGDLYVADVGQNQYEEVNTVTGGQGGGVNYGWNIMEGFHCFRTPDCQQEGLHLPVVEYSHSEGGCSITGGDVYRGARFPALTGNYFYGDFCSGYVWSLLGDEQGEWRASQSPVVTVDGNITTFGQDVDGELYLLTQQGTIYHIQPQ